MEYYVSNYKVKAQASGNGTVKLKGTESDTEDYWYAVDSGFAFKNNTVNNEIRFIFNGAIGGSFVAEPDEGYELDKWTYTLGANTYDIPAKGVQIRGTNINGDITLTAIFKQSHVHTIKETHSIENSTCLTAGHEAYYECDCGLFFSDSELTQEIGDLTALEAWLAEGGAGYIAPTGHHFSGEVTYTWEDDKCTASWGCDHEGCEETQTETVTGVYVKDTEATCTADEKGHYEATFTVPGFEKQSTAANSVTKADTATGHHFSGEVTYTWEDDKCTASWSCDHEGCSEKQTETVTGVYVKDTDATCTADEKGHYEATFTVPGFEKQSTPANSVQKGGTALGHDVSITYTWNENHTKCTAEATCSHCDYYESEEATVVIKDGVATASFNNKSFETQTYTFPPEEGLSGGAIAGITIGSIIALLVVAYFVMFFVWKKKDKAIKFLIPSFKWINKIIFKK